MKVSAEVHKLAKCLEIVKEHYGKDFAMPGIEYDVLMEILDDKFNEEELEQLMVDRGIPLIDSTIEIVDGDDEGIFAGK